MKKYISIIYIVFFTVFFILPTVLFPFVSQTDKNLENRNMTEKPTFSLSGIKTFPKEYENYYNDNLPFRSKLIGTNALINYKVFKQAPENKVIIGKDGWLFYNPPKEDSDPIGQCTDKVFLRDETLKTTAENLINIRNILSSNNRQFVAMLCPNKESIYGKDFLPKEYKAKSQSMGDLLAEYMQENTDINFVYPKKSLQESIKKYPQYDFYYKLDTHWNNLGGFIGAKELLTSINVEVPTFDEVTISSTEGRMGDLANMSGKPEMFIGDTSYTVDNYIQEWPSKNPEISRVTTYNNENGNGLKVLVIRDSFSEGLYPYLNSTFSQSNYIQITEFYPEVVEKCNPDIVILEVVERYLSRFSSFKIQ